MNDETKVGFFQQNKTIILSLIPAALLVYYLISSGIIESGLWLILVICPLMHLFMMWSMHDKKH